MAKVVFAGSPAIAVPFLRALASRHDVVAVITREDSPVGRRRILTETPVAQAATELGLFIIKTNALTSVTLPDNELGVVVAYGGLVPDDLLQQPAHGWVNAHFSLLPHLRGAAPVQRGLWLGDAATGISIFRLVKEMDAGPVYFQREIPFEAHETATHALDRLSDLTVGDLVYAVDEILEGRASSHEQRGPISFAPKFAAKEAHIDWNQPSDLVDRQIRALSDEPGAYALLGDTRIGLVAISRSDQRSVRVGHVVADSGRVYVGTSDGAIELVTVKPAGKSAMSASDWFRGLRGEAVFS